MGGMQDVQTPPPRRMRAFLIGLVCVVIAFGAGYIPQALEVRNLRATLKATDLDLRLANLHRQLGIASEEAQRNNFASAAAAAKTFFAGCRTVTQDEAFAEQPRTRAAIAAYAGYEDDTLLLLANANPTVKEKLASLYFAMEGVLDRRM